MERPKQMIGLGGGFFGGMSGAMSEMDLLMSEDLYLRVGIAVTDSLNLSPNKDWRRFAPLCFDAVYYFDRNYYFGGGLNYSIKISDDERPSLGGEAFIGLEFPVYDRHRIYGELGYSVAARAVGESFGGLHLLFGWRYEIIPAIIPEKKIITENTAPLVEIPITKPPEISMKKKYVYHYITRGDTLIKIANKYLKASGLYKQIAKMNNIKNPDHIIGGRYIKIDISNNNTPSPGNY
jgi:LysM repeat protein